MHDKNFKPWCRNISSTNSPPALFQMAASAKMDTQTWNYHYWQNNHLRRAAAEIHQKMRRISPLTWNKSHQLNKKLINIYLLDKKAPFNGFKISSANAREPESFSKNEQCETISQIPRKKSTSNGHFSIKTQRSVRLVK